MKETVVIETNPILFCMCFITVDVINETNKLSLIKRVT